MSRSVFASMLALALLSGCGGDEARPGEGAGGEAGEDPACNREAITTETGLQIQDLVCGEGQEAKSGDRVSVHYLGTLDDGTKFDASRDRGQPFEFTLGAGEVIPGWDEGIQGMKPGGLRKLTIPPELGYGEAGSPPVIPPNATLVFEVTLLEVTQPGR